MIQFLQGICHQNSINTEDILTVRKCNKGVDLPPKKDQVLLLVWNVRKGVIDGQEGIYAGIDY